jgi:hypothetical protein
VKAVVVPTINVPENLTKWAAMLDPEHDIIIVVGNERSPHAGIEDFVKTLPVPTEYMHPDGEVSRRWSVDKFLDPNHHHRRNLGVLQALSYGQTLGEPLEMLITIDDDNHPYAENWVYNASRLISQPNVRPVIRADSGWWNVGELCEPAVTHRGFPLWYRLRAERVQSLVANHERIGVVAGLWIGDPDIDAVERITLNPEVQYITNSVTLHADTWCPFDSQSTAIAGDLVPMLCMWTDVGRYDDIWASYLMRTVMDPLGYHVTYGEPSVIQRRNPHDLLKDLNAELYGMTNTERLCEALHDIRNDIRKRVAAATDDASASPWSCFKYAVHALFDRCPWLPSRTTNTLFAWCDDVDELGVAR